MAVLDVEFLSLAIHGPFSEKDIANSSLKRLDTGRILDHLAWMLERGLIEQAGHRYAMTAESAAYLWDTDTPVWLRVLRLLDIIHLQAHQMSLYLGVQASPLQDALDVLRLGGLAIMYPIKKDNDIVRMYHITDEGRNRLDRPGVPNPVSANDIIDALIRDVSLLGVDKHTKESILSRLIAIQKLIKAGVICPESEPK